MRVTVCICTYKRPELLSRTLAKLAEQHTKGCYGFSIVVADNDGRQSAKQVVAEFRAASGIDVGYCVEPEQNISLARNKALEYARGDYVALIDDDELPSPEWLGTLLRACEQYGVDGVLGPVRPWFDEAPPPWVLKGKLCERPEHPTGYVLPWRQTRTGNVLFKRKILDGIESPFLREFGNGGEDQDFFRRMMERGHRFIWCNEAVVHEVVPPERWTRSYMFRRALLRGQNEGPDLDAGSIAKSVVAIPAYAMLLPFLLIVSHHRFVSYCVRLLDHAGKLLVAVGLRPMGQKYLSR